MDLSLPVEFDSNLLNWDEEGPSSRDDQQQQSNAMESGSAEGSRINEPPPSGAGEGDQGLKPSSLSTQAMKDGFSRLPSFPTAIGGVPSAGEQNNTTQSTGTEQATETAAASNLTNPYAIQMLYPLTGGSQSASSTGAVNGTTSLQQQQQNLMVQYALTGQSAGAPFPNVSFNNDKRQMDTVSSLSTTTGNASTATSHGPSAKPAPAPVSVSTAPTAAQSVASQVTGELPSTQLHPLGIQSSAGCPPLSTTTAPASAPMSAMQFNPYMFSPYSMLASNPQLLAAYQSSQHQMAANFAAAQASAAQLTAAQASAAHLAAAQVAAVAQATNVPAPVHATHQKPKAKTTRKPKAKTKKASDKKEDAPPFLLFDAPCELRQNFMQSQRMLNLPVHEDSNSFHYGMAVNGFHPQLNVATDPIAPLSRDQPVLPPGIKLLDSRHKSKKGACKERNEREQKRAQKITELIEQIRVSMEDGGWKVEMKSKYHTLSMCSDYVKHLIKVTDEKEEAVEKAKADLGVKERKLEEDKALLEGRSDPESVTSSLTAETAGSGKAGNEAATKPVPGSGSKRKSEETDRDSGSDGEQKKKQKVEESNADSYDGGSGSGSGGSGPQGHNISIGKMSSSVSELTDSNRGSSDSGGEKANGRAHAAHRKHPRDEEDESSDLPSSSSISSTAAVLRGAGSHHREHGHADVVVKEKKHSRHRKRLREERSSLDRKFVIDYEEVFLTSNVPQIIATPAGRIVAWNKFFLKATGLSHDAVQRLTIFSLVQPNKLANLFEMVAEALRQKPAAVSESSSATSSSSTNESAPSSMDVQATPKATEYAAMTLPCTTFVKAPDSSTAGESENKEDPLYMTVTLMPDENVGKRCFHCVFTDCKGTDGKMGFITPALLGKLFAAPPKISTEAMKPQASTTAIATTKSDERAKEESKEGKEIEAVADGEGRASD